MASSLNKSQGFQRQMSKTSTFDSWDVTNNSQATTSNPSIRSPFSFAQSSFGMGSLMQISSAISDISAVKLERNAELMDQLTYEAHSQLARLGGQPDSELNVLISNHRAAIWLLDELKTFSLAVIDRLKEQNPSSLSKSWRGRIQSVKDQKKFDSSMINIKPTEESGKELEKSKAEANTYELVQKVLVIRKPEPTQVDLDSSIQLYLEVRGSAHEFTPEAELWERFLLSDQAARVKRAVLNWLEFCAQDGDNDIDTIVAELESSAGAGKGSWSHGFLHTRERIKAEKRKKWVDHPLDSQTLRNSENTEPLVTQLDPDAPTRQDRSLEKPDDYYDRALWLACFAMLRKGMSWEQIRDWCEERREGWRAISFGMAVDKQESRTGLAGPQAGLLWRQMCLAAARHSGFDVYQRAVYGLLAGDIKSVDPACRSFEDMIYVRYNAMLIRAFEEFLQKSASNRFSAVLGQKFPALNSTLTEEELSLDPSQYVFTVLNNPICSQDASNPFKIIQASIIGEAFESLIANLGLILAYRANQGDRRSHILPAQADYPFQEQFLSIADDFDAIRVVVHLFAIYEYAGYTFDPQLRVTYIENVLVAYIDYLRIQRKFEAIPTYAALLSDERRNVTLGVILADITDKHEQETLVNLVLKQNVELARLVIVQYEYAADLMGMSKYGLSDAIDMYDFVEPTADERWPGYRIRPILNPEETLPENQERLVRAVEWLQYEDLEAQWSDVFSGLSFAMRNFLLKGMVNGALALTKRVPYKAMSVIKSKPFLGRGVDVFNPDGDLAGDESQLRRSTRSSARTQTSEFQLEGEEEEFMLETLRSSCRQYREMQQLTQALECLALWRSLEDQISGREATPTVKKEVQVSLEELTVLMQPLLKSFMTTFNSEDDIEVYERIRRAYVPQIILAYNSARTFAANYLGPETILPSLELATILASDNNSELQMDFENLGLMGGFIKAMAGTSKVLIRLNQAREMANREDTGGKKQRRRKEKKSRFWMGETVDVWDPTKIV